MLGGAQLRPQRKIPHKPVERQITIIIIIGVEEPALLQAVQPMAHRVPIQHHFLGVLGQTTHSHLQQASLNLGRVVRQFVAASALVVGQLQAVERAGRRQGDAAVRRVQTVLSQGIGLVAGGGQEGIPAQLLVIVEVFVTLGQSVDALGQQLRQGVLDPSLVAPVVKALGQALDHPEIGVGLAQQQDAGVGGEGAARKVSHDFARAQVGEGHG